MSRSRYPGEARFHGPKDCYRTVLTRELTGALASQGRRVLFVMLNPSTATATEDDPTVRRAIGFAKREGGDHLTVCNLFALRSTDPQALYTHPEPEGDWENARAIAVAAQRAHLVVAAWGLHGAWKARGELIGNLLRNHAPGRVFCLGRTSGGHPSHPLYKAAANTPLEAF
jgi:hypothetical protein